MGELGRSPVHCTAAPVVRVDSIARDIGLVSQRKGLVLHSGNLLSSSPTPSDIIRRALYQLLENEICVSALLSSIGLLRQYYQIHKRALEPPEAAQIMSAYLRGLWNGYTKITTLLS